MIQYTIEPGESWYTNPRTGNRQRGTFLRQGVDAFYHAAYESGGNWRVPGTIENLIWTLKNDVSPFPHLLQNAKQRLRDILRIELPEISNLIATPNLTVCVVPRAKTEVSYSQNQLYFKTVVSEVANELNGFLNGTPYISRHTNTRTTHLDRNNEGGDGDLPYPGITIATCNISNEVRDRNILLIDDVYTNGANVDEDAIQALFNNGARSVTFYSIGYTVRRAQ